MEKPWKRVCMQWIVSKVRDKFLYTVLYTGFPQGIPCVIHGLYTGFSTGAKGKKEGKNGKGKKTRMPALKRASLFKLYVCRTRSWILEGIEHAHAVCFFPFTELHVFVEGVEGGASEFHRCLVILQFG